MKKPDMLEMLKSGVHFGHQTAKWHPKMAPYIFGVRSGIHIIDLEQTKKQMESALEVMHGIAASGGTILFIGTKRQGAKLLRESAEKAGMPFVDKRWLGGTITNFSVIHKLLRKYNDLRDKRDNNKLMKYTKKERLQFDRQIAKMESLIGGISQLQKIPDAVFILDTKKEKSALDEARKKGVPVIAICDTNVNPSKVTHPIPGNDDATKSIEYLLSLVSETIIAGRKEFEKNKPAVATKPSKPVAKKPVAKKEKAKSEK